MLFKEEFPFREVASLVVLFAVGALWLANAHGYSPIHWLFVYGPGLHEFKDPSRGLILTVPAVLGLAVVGIELLLGMTEGHRSWAYLLAFLVGVVALADVYLVPNWVPDVDEVPTQVQQAIQDISQRDQGYYLVDFGDFGNRYNNLVVLELAEADIPLASTLSPLVPEHQFRHKLVGPAQRVRYWFGPVPQEPKGPGSWELIPGRGEVRVFKNTEATGEAWLVDREEQKVLPLALAEARPGRFATQADAERELTLLVPANYFSGWKVSIDGAPSISAEEFDGYASTQTLPGQHTYEFYYDASLVPLILVLASLPWVVLVLFLWRGVASVLRRGPEVLEPLDQSPSRGQEVS